MNDYTKEQIKTMKRLEKKYDQENNKILDLLKINLIKRTYKTEDVIKKLSTTKFPADTVITRIYSLRKQGIIYELPNKYLIPLLDTPEPIKKALVETAYYYDPKLKEHILRLIKKRKEPITEKEVLILSEMEGFREDEIKIVIYELYRGGDIYKPRKGCLKAIDSIRFR